MLAMYRLIPFRLRTLFLTIVNLVMSGPIVIDAPYLGQKTGPPFPILVDKWLQEMATVKEVSDYPSPETLIVEEFSHLKSPSDKEHERLMITITNPATRDKTHFVTERFSSDEKPSGSSSLPSTPTSQTPSANQLLILSGYKSAANDTITLPILGQPTSVARSNFRGSDYILSTLTLDPDKTRLTLPELASILHAVNLHSSTYHLWSSQCYWYAGAVWDIVRQGWGLGGTVSNDTLARKRGTYNNLSVSMAAVEVDSLLESARREHGLWCETRRESREQTILAAKGAQASLEIGRANDEAQEAKQAQRDAEQAQRDTERVAKQRIQEANQEIAKLREQVRMHGKSSISSET